jgi:metal-sulfur cluster biosynthetic enzyme
MVDSECRSIKSEALALLNGIIDPCSRALGVPAGLVDLGLVSAVDVLPTSEGPILRVALRLTEPGCMMAVPFVRESLTRLEALSGVWRLEVSIDHAFDWRPGDMSESYRSRLAAHRAARAARAARADGSSHGDERPPQAGTGIRRSPAVGLRIG